MLSGVEGVADTCATGVVALAIVAGTIARDVHFSGCSRRVASESQMRAVYRILETIK